jgi:hypothetical protein
MELKATFSAIAVILTFIAFVPYIRSVHAGQTKPHIFSWIIWASTTLIVSVAQWQAEGGVGAWPTAISGVITAYIACLAWLHKGDSSITKSDWLFLVAAYSALPFWYIFSDPLWAVVILTSVDILGFGPTLRKAWQRPNEENTLFFVLFVIRSVFAIIALERLSLTTVLFPAAVGLGCIALVTVVWLRRLWLGTRVNAL